MMFLTNSEIDHLSLGALQVPPTSSRSNPGSSQMSTLPMLGNADSV